jgi:hypothetical protein
MSRLLLLRMRLSSFTAKSRELNSKLAVVWICESISASVFALFWLLLLRLSDIGKGLSPCTPIPIAQNKRPLLNENIYI